MPPRETHIYSEHQAWIDAIMDYSNAHVDDYAIPCDDFMKLRFGVRFARSDIHFYHQFLDGECTEVIADTSASLYQLLAQYDDRYPESSWSPHTTLSSASGKLLRGWICFEARKAILAETSGVDLLAFTPLDTRIPFRIRRPYV